MVSKLISCLFLLFFSCKLFSNGTCDPQEKHIIVLDAGSTGSRIYIYKYDSMLPLETISEVAHKRVNPALSTFVNDSVGLRAQLNILIAFAKTITPSSCWSSTNISLKATAGLRSLKVIDQEYLINVTRLALANSGFLSDPANTKVISGEEEALFDLLAVTVLFQTQEKGFTSLGAADMGGSSQQIAFSFTQKTNNLVGENWFNFIYKLPWFNSVQSVALDGNGDTVRLEVPPDLPGYLGCRPDWRIHVPGTDKSIVILAKSLEYMGLIAAMDTVLDRFYEDAVHVNRSNIVTESTQDTHQCITNEMYFNILSPNGIIIPRRPLVDCQQPLHPCLPDGVFVEVPGFNGHPQPLYGSGDFEKCHQLLRNVLVPQAQRTIDLECMKQYRPKVMIGMDNYPKILEILGIPQGVAITPAEIKRRALEVCNRPWEELLADYPGFMPYRAQRACFGATYVYSLLIDVYGIDEDDENAFIPVDSVGEYELSWALGAAVFSAMGLQYESMREIENS